MALKDGVELASVIVRGNARGSDAFSGYEFAFEPKAQTVCASGGTTRPAATSARWRPPGST